MFSKGCKVYNRFFTICAFSLFSTGCAVSPEPAALLTMPEKPLLKSKTYQVMYKTEHNSPKVKSVQLPAHQIKRNQTVSISADKASVTDTLYTQISDALKEKNLKVIKSKQADFTLSIHQLDLNLVEDTEYPIYTPEKPFSLFYEIASQYPAQQCATINAQVSMRLTHRASGDVVWFAKSSIDSASFHREALIYDFTEEETITNELEVASFIHQQNTDQARLARANKTVSTPNYQTIAKVSNLTKVQGPCDRTEVSALTPMMQYYLSSILIDKIKVQ